MRLDVQAEKKSQAKFFTLAGAVFWSFLGIRRRQDYESDAASISLKQAVIAGIIGGVIFVVGVVVLVKAIMASIGTTT